MPATENNYYDADMGYIWVQPGGPNTELYLLFCSDLDGMDESLGDVSSYMGRENAQWYTTHRSQGLPSEVTFDIETYKPKSQSWLQRQAALRCPMPVYVHNQRCPPSTFWGFESGQVGRDALITNKSGAANVRGKAASGDGAGDPTMQTFSFSASPIAPEYWQMVSTPRPVSGEPLPFRDIAILGPPYCGGPCGTQLLPGETGFAVPDSAPAAALATPWMTTTGFVTVAGAAADPAAAGEDLSSCVVFQLDKDTTRYMVAVGEAAAAGLRIMYSDDAGATWTTVIVDASVTDYCMHSGGLFALDATHIWLCTFESDVWFSNDGGLTWTDQDAPTPGANESLYSINFIDPNYGWAVGGFRATPTCHLLRTTDGGEHWATVTTEPQVELATGVAVLDSVHVWVTMDDGTLWYSNDWGATWAQRTVDGSPTIMADVKFIDRYAGFVCGSTATVGLVWRTVNGGFSWEVHEYPTAWDALVEFGFHAIEPVSYSKVYAAGELVGAVGVLWILENTQPA